ncbi:MAG: ABC transporter permease [Roseburia sp.]|nr:ABC transporter permease [Roseburia sp.]MCM1097100.1 ABC transporter permease [Ruminococcus flavefaciens]
MFRIMLQKLWSKKWMNLCLLLGSILLIATVVSFPLYEAAVYDGMLQDVFRDYIEETGKWPTINRLQVISKRDNGGKTVSRMEKLTEEISGSLGVTLRENIHYYALSSVQAHSLMNRSDEGKLELRLASLSGLAEHAKLLTGEMYSEEGLTEDGAIEVVVSQACLTKNRLLIGETLVLEGLRDAEKQEIRICVRGVFDMEDRTDVYWQIKPDEMELACLMNPELYTKLFTGENAGRYTMTCTYYSLFEYEDIVAGQVAHLAEATEYLTDESEYRNTLSPPDYQGLLEEYLKKQERIRATLVILQIPVLIMLGAFLFMISCQMYEMEGSEISVIKSRGSSRVQLFRLYLYQSCFLTLVGGLLGLPLGAVFSRLLGSARNFLEFDRNRNLNVAVTGEALVYMAAAMVVTLLIMTLPAIRHSRVSIVHLKQQKALKKRNWWEIIFLDVILLALSLYGYYTFSRGTEELQKRVLAGETMDPLLYISSSLFVVGMGLLALRLQPLLVRLIYLCGKRFWRPASYASFQENLKNGRKQQFIMLFLIMTISLGMYHATVARTIMQNAVENKTYLDGVDFVLREVWLDNGTKEKAATRYIEPDYAKYSTLDCAESYTRVIRDEDARWENALPITLLGIHTREFGENTWVDPELLGEHYYELLNKLAVAEDGVLVSENFHTKQGRNLGDRITFQNSDGNEASGKIVGFFRYWPGYRETESTLNPDGTVATVNNYMVVAHYDALRLKWGATPYEVWITLKEGRSSDEVYDWIEEQGIRVNQFADRPAALRRTAEDPLLQGTNGVLTMGFIVTLLLCGVGYLIYWIMSIRSREMIFGVLRACGMHKGELFHMLMNEQIFSGAFSVAVGIGVGKLTSRMFVPMLQQTYAAADQVLPLKLVTDSADMFRLYGVIGAVIVICLAVLIVLLLKMNVAKALKLGEE